MPGLTIVMMIGRGPVSSEHMPSHATLHTLHVHLPSNKRAGMLLVNMSVIGKKVINSEDDTSSDGDNHCPAAHTLITLCNDFIMFTWSRPFGHLVTDYTCTYISNYNQPTHS